MASIKLLALASLFYTVTSAASELPIILRIEQSQSGLLEQNALIMTTDETKMTRNSNFICGPQKSTFLGSLLTSPTNSQKTDYQYLSEVQNRLKSSPSIPPGTRSSWRTYLGQIDTSNSALLKTHMIRSIKELCDWQPASGVKAEGASVLISADGKEIFLKYTSSTKTQTIPVEEANCTPSQSLNGINYLRCIIPKLGVAYLAK